MTKVQITYKLTRELSEQDLKSLARVTSVYGIFGARLRGTGDELFVEYDASRLSAKEVRGTLEEHGIPVA
ncbi:MAG TPA: hypothetical protein VFB14_04235 [Bryobacteraceae bacterium]|jgi:methylglyoxal synthase|nr:hypothetical protein [Bryobacteraceae bacterium]